MQHTDNANVPFYRRPTLWLALMVTLYALFFSLLTVQRHQAQLTTANDLGIFDQLMWNIGHGRGMQRSIEINYPHWGVHTQPILYLLLPFYLLFPAAETLLVLQSLALALAAVPLFLITLRETGRASWSLLLAAAFLLSPAIQGMNLIDFHPYALAPLFLLWAFYFLETPNIKLFVLFAALAVACKEDVALAIAAMGLYALLIKRQRTLGLVTLAAGLGWYFFAIGVWQPRVSGGVDKQGWRYQALAWPLPELARTILTRPQVWIPYALEPAKRAYLLGLLLPFGLLPLLAPQVTLLALPALLINLLSSFAAQHEPDLFQYNAAIVPFLALAAGRALAWLQRLPQARWRRQLTTLALALLAGGSLSYHVLYGHTPLAANFDWPQSGEHQRVREKLLTQIPPDAPVSAQTTLVPHLSQRPAIWEYPTGLETAEFVLLDVTAPHYTILLTDDYYTSIKNLGVLGFGLLTAEDGYLLFQRGAPAAAQTLPESFYSYALSTTPGADQARAIDFGPLQLVNSALTLLREGRVELALSWRADGPLPSTLRPAIALGFSDGPLTAWHRQDLPLQWETRNWAEDEILQLTTGVSTAQGGAAGWNTGWTLYAGVVDDASGQWLQPENVGVRSELIDGQTAYLVPVAEVRNSWGLLHGPVILTDQGE